ncbi:MULTISPECIES: transketolase-like TK C-terminal-containing protein [Pseudomonas]|uniref:Pyruvate dehydrogenase n=1 Tax=Pseudomonas simiae TaxID=321846 RepID=U1UA30_9PSED|nr:MULTISPECIES: pyruvate dehydrogenase [Pseudomonas]MBD8738654.1 pyruvate dehydrogenase [Pseudomonas fluorescens]AJZ95445.1 pyruvate dehydrogenase [Pseudomonas simiae]ERH51872.1 pyruvate dehydrogenase [Pseudomonas simiae]KIQ06761.1 pyruvate dehydrogenase [Pseudomonas simiae]MBC3965675.1 pyruvate dehydrogenase [Pseudomonas simiae]
MTAATAHAAQLCINALSTAAPTRHSPLYTVINMANTLELSRQAWVIRGQSSSRRMGNWPGWFARNTTEKPLLYLHSAQSSAQLSALSDVTQQRGILCNDIENQPSRWPKGAQPSLPLWLATHPCCTPYDPASGEEARAIVLAALRSLYVDGKPGFYYLALHDHEGATPLSEQDREAVLEGMYPLQQDTRGDVRLLGAGRALAEVVQAKRLLAQDWNITAQLWSCPSYTRLAREAAAVERWNRLHPGVPKRSCHLRNCLAGSAAPVIAVTGYPQAIVDQLGAHVDARFVALGAGSVQASAPSRYWIVVAALRALADEGCIDALQVEAAMNRYALVYDGL